MKLDAWLFRVGEVVTLLAIYAAVGGPNLQNGGTMIALGAALMVVPVLYRGFGIIRREVPV